MTIDRPDDVVVFIGDDPDRPTPGAWVAQAACTGVDPDLFFPERGASLTEARKVCAACPVRVECLDYALDAGEKFGVWGGTSEKDRRRMRRTRHLARVIA